MERQPGRAESAVMARVERRDDVEEVIGVAVRDQQTAKVADGQVLLQPRERAGAGVEPQVEPVGAEQVPAALTCGARPRALRAEHGQPHAASSAITARSTSPTSRPSTCSARRRNADGSPVVANACSGGVSASRSASARTSSAYTSLAVSSADDTKTTSGPISSWSKPDNSG